MKSLWNKLSQPVGNTSSQSGKRFMVLFILLLIGVGVAFVVKGKEEDRQQQKLQQSAKNQNLKPKPLLFGFQGDFFGTLSGKDVTPKFHIESLSSKSSLVKLQWFSAAPSRNGILTTGQPDPAVSFEDDTIKLGPAEQVDIKLTTKNQLKRVYGFITATATNDQGQKFTATKFAQIGDKGETSSYSLGMVVSDEVSKGLFVKVRNPTDVLANTKISLKVTQSVKVLTKTQKEESNIASNTRILPQSEAAVRILAPEQYAALLRMGVSEVTLTAMKTQKSTASGSLVVPIG